MYVSIAHFLHACNTCTRMHIPHVISLQLVFMFEPLIFERPGMCVPNLFTCICLVAYVGIAGILEMVQCEIKYTPCCIYSTYIEDMALYVILYQTVASFDTYFSRRTKIVAGTLDNCDHALVDFANCLVH